MTTAIQVGRQLRLDLEGIDAPFLVDPLPAIRGRALTDLFVLNAAGQGSALQTESIFPEAFGPANYARMTGLYVDEYDEAGAFVASYDHQGRTPAAGEPLPDGLQVRFLARQARAGEAEIPAEPIRANEAEQLALAAFFWQTIVGMDGVQALLEGGEGAGGSLKALNLLVFRLGISPSPTLHDSALETLTSTAGSSATTTLPAGGTPAKLPPNKRGFLSKATRRHPRAPQ